MFMLIAGKEVAKWVYEKTGGALTETSNGLGWSNNGLTAGVALEGYNQHNIFVHQRIDSPPPRKYWYSIADYCFNQLGCKRITTSVPADNQKALKLNSHVGFEYEGTLKGASDSGEDIIVQVLWKDKCKFLRWNHG